MHAGVICLDMWVEIEHLVTGAAVRIIDGKNRLHWYHSSCSPLHSPILNSSRNAFSPTLRDETKQQPHYSSKAIIMLTVTSFSEIKSQLSRIWILLKCIGLKINKLVI